MMYLVIYRGEDEPWTNWYTEDEVKEFLKDNPGITFLRKPVNIMEWPSNSAFIVKGTICFPTPVETVTKWKV